MKQDIWLLKYFFSVLEFTPLEFETEMMVKFDDDGVPLEFTPLEFETLGFYPPFKCVIVLEFTPLEFETY